MDAIFKQNLQNLLSSRLDYWFAKKKYAKGFFKFIEPCPHPLYKEGDSWREELGIARKTFNTLFDAIGIRYKSKSAFFREEDPFKGKKYASYHDRKTHRVFFIKNQERPEKGEKINTVTALDTNRLTLKSINTFKTILSSKKADEIQKDQKEKIEQIWKDEIGEIGPQTYSSKIGQIFETFFEGCLEKWKAFCQKIASSQFLMGEKTSFKAWLTWALTPSVIEKIEKGFYSLGDRVSPKDKQEQEKKVQAQTQTKAITRELHIVDTLISQTEENLSRERKNKISTVIKELSPEEKQELLKDYTPEQPYNRALKDIFETFHLAKKIKLKLFPLTEQEEIHQNPTYTTLLNQKQNLLNKLNALQETTATDETTIGQLKENRLLMNPSLLTPLHNTLMAS